MENDEKFEEIYTRNEEYTNKVLNKDIQEKYLTHHF